LVKKYTVLFILLLLPIWTFAHDKAVKQEKKAPEQKVIRAIRAEAPIRIDGSLDEKVWLGPGYSDFIQSDPIDGSQPSEKTEIWVAYDDTSLYVAARLYDSDPQSIKKFLGRRDDELDSDWFTFAVDPAYDRRTGYQFSVNPAGSIRDMTLSNDVNEDETWDAIWEWKTQVNDKSWTVEIRIPFNQLRFPKKTENVWGVNFIRKIMRKQERVCFVWIPKEETAFVSRFARLEGIKDIKPDRNIELLPYTVGQAEYKQSEDGNPFERGHKYRGNLGFDLKVGLKSNLTMDATVNPDFGQVEVDPAVINLSAYETYYEEKRPFFIEGADIFNGFGRGGVYLNANINWPNPIFFYSRRIGRAPQGYVTESGYVNFPDRTNILGAAKITGKLGGGWNLGFLNALTSREFAQIDSLGARLQQEVEPLTYYGALRVQKDIEQGQRGFGIMGTGVTRDLGNEPLQGMLHKNALSLALDGWTFLDKKRAWVIGGWFGGTRVEGSREDILRLQYSSMHYYQRPDADHIRVNPYATSLSGWGARFSLAKQQGRFLLLSAIGALSPGFDPNDLGFQYSMSDKINGSLLLAYQWTKPGKVFRNAVIIAGPFQNYDFGGNKTWEGVLAEVEAQFLNYWGFDTMLAYNPNTISNNLTRGGPLALIPRGYQIDFRLESDGRKAVVLEGSSSFYRRHDAGTEWFGQLALHWKPRSNINLSFGPQYGLEKSEIQWVSRVEDSLMTSTYGVRYVFGRINQRTISSEIRLNWIFTPKLSLQLYLQPFVAVGKYGRFKELARPRKYDYNLYGHGLSTINFAEGIYTVDPDGPGPASAFSFGNPDFNYKSLRGTLVLRWEYLPGSLLYFVWTQNRADYAYPGDFQFRRDLGNLLTAPGDNIFLFKVSYRWNL
jgi:hypothetical protein